MFDLKVITAVFVTLLGIAIGMSQGAVGEGDLEDFSGFLGEIMDAPNKIIDIFTGNNPVETPVDLRITLDRIPEFKKEFSRPLKTVKFDYNPGEASVTINDAKFSSKETTKIEMSNFKGTLEMHDEIYMKGSVDTSSLGDYVLNSTSIRINVQGLGAGTYEVDEMLPISFSFENSGGTITLEKSDIFLKNESLRIVSFKGDMKLDFDDDKFFLNGTASEVFVGGEEVNIMISD